MDEVSRRVVVSYCSPFSKAMQRPEQAIVAQVDLVDPCV
eukprot:SAG11_NODE_31703_length_289_cov_7.231579_1_plen_38_part_01